MFDDDPTILDFFSEETAPTTDDRTTDTRAKTLAEARAAFEAELELGKTRCPCCDRFAKIQSRRMHRTQALFLVRLVARWLREPKPYSVREVQETPQAEKASSDASFLRHWGLISKPADDQYIPTDKGIAFVRGELTVPSHIRTYAGGCRGLTGDQISIHDALGEPFDLDALRAV